MILILVVRYVNSVKGTVIGKKTKEWPKQGFLKYLTSPHLTYPLRALLRTRPLSNIYYQPIELLSRSYIQRKIHCSMDLFTFVQTWTSRLWMIDNVPATVLWPLIISLVTTTIITTTTTKQWFHHLVHLKLFTASLVSLCHAYAICLTQANQWSRKQFQLKLFCMNSYIEKLVVSIGKWSAASEVYVEDVFYVI